MLHLPLLVTNLPSGLRTVAAGDIPAGTLIWSAPAGDETVFTMSETQAWAVVAAGVPVRQWSMPAEDGQYVVAFDGSQFMQHRSDQDTSANTLTCPACGAVTASRPIVAGEEVCRDRAVDRTRKVRAVRAADGRPAWCANPDCR